MYITVAISCLEMKREFGGICLLVIIVCRDRFTSHTHSLGSWVLTLLRRALNPAPLEVTPP
jgi:uncharacterized membrane protein